MEPAPPPLLLLLLLGFAIFDCVTGDGNGTAEQETKRLSCGYPNGNCTGGTTGLRWRGHFSKCPEEYKHYCIKGRCRYVAAEQIPACVYCKKRRRKRREEEMMTFEKRLPIKTDDILETDIA
ncbi:Betacellulin [Podarcis lilfordi]|uniref:Betacellulin n=1 Tax=Podarcis lilfordi TaxID=74358 RepID=A0AA35PM51_9SAUR|nr:Betacellulin [Podarcis lilfordi]